MTIATTVAHLIATAKFRAASLFDRGVEGAIGGLVKFDRKLDAYIQAQQAKREAVFKAGNASFDRQDAAFRQFRSAVNREVQFREGVEARAEDLRTQAERAQRIRDRIAEILD